VNIQSDSGTGIVRSGWRASPPYSGRMRLGSAISLK
jgi:hypothetical protein